MDEKSKREALARYERIQEKFVGHEEQKRRRAASAERRHGRGDARRRRRDWDEDDDGLEGFDAVEKIRRPQIVTGVGRSRGESDTAGLPRAVVVALHHGRVQLDTGATARIAGHLLVDQTFRLAVGDEVRFVETEGPPRIEALVARRTCLSRPDPGNPHRALIIAANIDLAVIVVAAMAPPLRPGLIDRLLLAVAHGGVAPAICVNKIDLLGDGGDERRALEQTIAPYANLGCDVFRCSASTGAGIAELRAALVGRTCVFVGHSGVGKSSVLNAVDPDEVRRTGEVRPHDGCGRHTTTSSSLRVLADGTRVIDTPGVRAFGLDQLDAEQARVGFAELANFARGCRFSDCAHVREPECAVRRAAASGELSPARYASYLRILEDM